VAVGEVEPLGNGGGRIPDSLAAVVRKAMGFDREARYASVAGLQADIAAFQNGFATSAEQAGAWKQFTLFVKRNKAASIGVAAVLLVGGVLGTKAILEGQRAAREATRAQRGEALAQSEATHAKKEAERAERGEAAAKTTLADLRRTAPVFYAQAKVDFEEGNFEAAIEKVGYAIQLDDTAADYHLFRANLRESSQDLAAAVEGYRRVLALRPADAAAKANLALCEKLLREGGGAPLGRPQQTELLTALRTEKRLLEAAPLAALIDPDIALAKAALLSRLREARKGPRWKDVRVSALPDGTFKIDLSTLAPIDFSVLEGQPVSILKLDDTGIEDLSTLAGAPLKELSLRHTKAIDLSPLRGMPLESLDLAFIPLRDLSALRGMKLQKLSVFTENELSDLSPLAGMPLMYFTCQHCGKVSDLSPLHGAPLVELNIAQTSVASLAPLAGAPLKRLEMWHTKVTDITSLSQFAGLEELDLDDTSISDLTPLAQLHLTFLDCGSTRITSIAPLRGQPLRKLSLEKTGVTDLRPLDGCTTLEEITLPTAAVDLSNLRKLPNLRFISTRSAGNGLTTHPTQTAENFWKEYDAQQAGSLRQPGEPPAPLPPSSAGKQ
jgi:tetratricopeptide (TPR) repeat protein